MQTLGLKHHSILDVMMSNPGMSLTRVAKEIGMGITTVRRITEMKEFTEEYERRRKQYEVFSMKKRIAAVGHLADTAIELMQDRLDLTHNPDGTPLPPVPMAELKIAAELALKASGMIGPARTHISIDNSTSNTQINNMQVDIETLKIARQRILDRAPSLALDAPKVVNPQVVAVPLTGYTGD